MQGLGGVYDEVFLPLHGAHQAQNAIVALAAAEAFLGAGSPQSASRPNEGVGRQLDPDVVREGFSGTTSPGRLERVRTAPTILLDAANNPHGMAAAVHALQEEFSFSRLIVVLAVLADKDVTGMLALLEPITDTLVCTRNTSPRAMSADALADLAETMFSPDRVRVEPFLPDAIETAVALVEASVDTASSAVGVLITGSVITAAEARTLLVR
jgi:dihydrofolate synthase/folylpolyglutamate synthase